MRALELKIPPVLVTVIFAVLMWVVSIFFPGLSAPLPVRAGLFVFISVTGAIFSLAGVLVFVRVKTTVNPITPNASSSLVTTGVYKRSRNPMYVGFLLFLIALGFFLFNLFSLAIVAAYVSYMNRFQIRPEETALEQFFGENYRVYKKKVRRWL